MACLLRCFFVVFDARNIPCILPPLKVFFLRRIQGVSGSRIDGRQAAKSLHDYPVLRLERLLCCGALFLKKNFLVFSWRFALNFVPLCAQKRIWTNNIHKILII